MGPYNPSIYTPNLDQYGVGMPQAGSGLSALSGLASWMPVVGPAVGAGLNFIGQAYQNYKQAQYFDKYMSPEARMAQMQAAGINPNAAAQGISGSSAPQMNAAAPTSAFTGIGEQLGNSVNTALTAENIQTTSELNKANKESVLLDNDLKRVELGMKPEMLNAELDELKSRAEQQKAEVKRIDKEIEKFNQEIDNLKTDKLHIIAQIGEIEYKKRLEEAEANAANAKAALDEANKKLAETNNEIAEKERDNYLTPEERLQKEAQYQEEEKVKNDPELRTKKALTDQFEKDNAELQSEIDRVKKELHLYKTGQKKDNYFGTNKSKLEYELKTLINKQKNLKDQYYKDLRRYNSNKSMSVGLHGVSKSD